jgi:predicted nucleic acid-binding protein
MSILKKVYVETSVVSAYFEERTDLVSVAQRFWTRQWWDELRHQYEVVVSQAVIDELQHPDYPYSQETLKLIEHVPKVSIENDIRPIVKIYIQERLMPQNPVGDALHLALASYHKCDFLLTWNCKHLANPNKFQRIRLCNQAIGLYVPVLVTPNQLIGERYD